jgi:type VI secretion system secreted protein Hcp
MAVDMFIKIGDLKGESKDKAYKEWIDVLSWSWGMSQQGSFHMGGGGGAGKVNVHDLAITKQVDKASTELMLRVATGKHFPEATLIARKAGDKPLVYLTIKLTDVIVTSWSSGAGSGSDMTTENITLNFSKFNVKYTGQEATGGAGTQPEVTYDIAGGGEG